jgi:tRNA wybutosine-synthesizing protein 3
MDFDNDKKMHLEKEDKSSKGSIDEPIKKLCAIINSLDDYYTTSSCSGRTAIYKMPDSGKKNETGWLYVSHGIADIISIKSTLQDMPAEDVWLRFEPLIIHVAVRDLDSAKRLLDVVHAAGIKRSGIIALGERIVLEIIGTERIDTIIGKGSRLLISEEYLRMMVEEANRKMQRNWDNIAKLEEEMIKLK